MSNINTGGPAFPFVCDADFDYGTSMTLRDYFAAKAMQAMLSKDPEYHQRYEFIDLAYFSYQCADAMLKAREQ